MRCIWCSDDPDYVAYHDREWGVPVRDDTRLFEMLTLEGAQAGLSWLTILRKRDHYRHVFADFDVHRLARWTAADIEPPLADPGIVRNRRKVESVVRNARGVLDIIDEQGSFSAFLWRYVDGEPQQNAWRRHADIPVSTPTSRQLSRDLKRRGFGFVGPTICYAFMQAVGMVNDHVVDCFRHAEVRQETER